MIKKRTASGVAGLALALALTGALGAAAATASAVPARPAASAAPGVPAVTAGPVPAGFEPASVTFISAADAWVIGTTKTCAKAPCTAVLRTTDGGRVWHSVPAPRVSLSAGLLRLRFASSANGFAYGSQLWVTHNGAASWHRVRQVPGYITDLETSAGVVYLVTQQGSKVAVYSSPAHSDSWHRVAGLPRRTGSAGIGAITLHGKAGWIILDGRIYATSNGSGWAREGFRCPRTYAIDSVGAYSAKRISVLCSGLPALGSTPKLVYVSANGGASFTKAGTPPSGGDGGLLAEPTPSHLFIATSSGATWTYVSTDGGRRWRDGSLSLDDGGLGLYDFGFTTTRQGVAVEGTPHFGSKLWITRDAGRHWHQVHF